MKNRVNSSDIDTSVLLDESIVQFDPPSNTGSNSQLGSQSGWSSRVDNLTILWSGTAKMVENVCITFFGIRFDWHAPVPRKVGIFWDRTWVSECGALLCERDIGDGRVASRLALGGAICGSVNALRLRGFGLWCQASLPHIRVSRIDLAIDDYDRTINPQDIADALASGNYAGFRRADTVKNHGTKWGGWTYYLGRRDSDKVVRVYDKFAESKGMIDSIRFELEAHDEYAAKIFEAWCECTHDADKIQHLIVNYAIGQLRFINKIDKNISRCPNLAWWDEFISHLKSTPIRMTVVRIKTSVERKIDWLRRSVSKSLAVINDAVGSCRALDLVADCIETARLRYTGQDLIAIDKYRKLVDV